MNERDGAGDRVVLLSDRLWRQDFAASPDVIQHTLVLNGRSYHVVGVMPADFAYPSDPDVWLPMSLPIRGIEIFEAFRLYLPITVIARVADGQTATSAGSALATLERQFPVWKYTRDSSALALAQPLRRSFVRADTRHGLTMLTVAAALFLIVVTSNLASLLVARGLSQQGSNAVRLMLGATRATVVRETLAEVLILVAGGFAVGLGLALIGRHLLEYLLPPDLVAIARPRIGARTVLATGGIAAVIGAIAGSWPAYRASRQPYTTLRSTTVHGSTTRAAVLGRTILMAGQLGIALTLLITAGLLVQSARRLAAAGAAFDDAGLLTAQVTLSESRYASTSANTAFFRAALAVLQHLPGVSAAGIVDVLPLSGESAPGPTITSDRPGVDPIHPLNYFVAPGYFAAIGIALERGRDFALSDDSNAHVVIVNRRVADALWPGENPIGRYVRLDGADHAVVGVIRNVNTLALGDTVSAQIYQPLLVYGARSATFVVRGTGTGRDNLQTLRERLDTAIRSVDGHQIAYSPRSMAAVLSTAGAVSRARARLFSLFGTLASVLTAAGLYALLAFTARHQRREFGIRLALGSTRLQLLTLMWKRVAVLTSVGVAIGLGGAAFASRSIASMLHGVDSRDLGVWAAATTLLVGITIVAAALPAWEAANSNPVEALRSD